MEKQVRKRVFNIEQFEYNRRTQYSKYGVLKENEKPLITEEKINEGLAHTSIKRWAWIRHDEDVYGDEDCKKLIQKEVKRLHKDGKEPSQMEKAWAKFLYQLEKNENDWNEFTNEALEWVRAHNFPCPGDKKLPHYHIVLECKDAIPVKNIAKWFGVPENAIAFPRGKGAFIDCVQYLTHEDEKQMLLGKHLYPDEKVHANFDFRSAINDKVQFGALSDTQRVEKLVWHDGVSLSEIKSKYPGIYMEDFARIDKLRGKYISENAPMPNLRINFYIYGKGGVGKTFMAYGIARELFPNIKNEEDIVFKIGGGNTTFDKYDGQPVVIWDDFRAGEIIRALGGRGNMLNVFDPHPYRQQQNVKYGSVCLINSINIVTGQEEYTEFMARLAGEYTDKLGRHYEAEDVRQSYRRFPIIIPVHEDSFDLLINKGFAEDNSDFMAYRKLEGIQTNLKALTTAKTILDKNGNSEGYLTIEEKAFKPITDTYRNLTSGLLGISANMPVDDQIKLWETIDKAGTGGVPKTVKIDSSEYGVNVDEQVENLEDGTEVEQLHFADVDSKLTNDDELSRMKPEDLPF